MKTVGTLFRFRSGATPVLFCLSLLFAFCARPVAAAETFLNAEVRLTFEDNVVGLLSDKHGSKNISSSSGNAKTLPAAGMGGGQGKYVGAGSQSPGDMSVTLSADVGKFADLGRDSAVFAKGFAEHTSYDQYTEFDSTIAGAAAGMNHFFSNTLSGRLSLFGKLKRFEDGARNSIAYGGNASLKQKLRPQLWLRESLEYEINNADSSDFSYTGVTIGVGAGYALSKKTLVTGGMSYLVQQYDDIASSELTTTTLSLGLDRIWTKTWSLWAGLDVQTSEADGSPATTNNIVSFGLRYGI